jgi:CHAD domain-containing protein
MTSRLPSDLLRRSAEEGSRLLALAQLDDIASAEQRLPDPGDTEALHDFRVGLRRLRSTLRAYRAQLKGSVSRKARRRLKDLTTGTNAGRDMEVQLAWLHRQAERLGPGETEGLAWLIGRLEGRKSERVDQGTAEIARDFSKAAPKLRRRLGTFRVEVRTGRDPKPSTFGQATGGLIQSHLADLAESLKSVTAVDDDAPAHAARIRAKRLRYLLEPLSRRVRGVKPLVGRLRQLQDLLGNLHDMHVMLGEIDSAVEALSRNTPDRSLLAEPGLAALKRLAHVEAEESFAGFRAAWGDSRTDLFLSRTYDLGSVLQNSQGIEDGPLPLPKAAPDQVSQPPSLPAERAEPVASDGNRFATTRPSPVG